MGNRLQDYRQDIMANATRLLQGKNAKAHILTLARCVIATENLVTRVVALPESSLGAHTSFNEVASICLNMTLLGTNIIVWLQ